MSARSAKLNVGCGGDIRPGWVNHDVAALPGVDVVHGLNEFPWPFDDGQFEEVVLINVLEHLRNTVRTLEELHRITEAGGRITIRVPFWNAPDAISDPTHERFFNEQTFDFFDPSTRHGQTRPYYSSARFTIRRRRIWIRAFGRYLPLSSSVLRAPFLLLARYLGGVVWAIEVELATIKDAVPTSRPPGSSVSAADVG